VETAVLAAVRKNNSEELLNRLNCVTGEKTEKKDIFRKSLRMVYEHKGTIDLANAILSASADWRNVLLREGEAEISTQTSGRLRSFLEDAESSARASLLAERLVRSSFSISWFGILFVVPALALLLFWEGALSQRISVVLLLIPFIEVGLRFGAEGDMMDNAASPPFTPVPTAVDFRLVPAVFVLALHSATITVGGTAGLGLLFIDFICLPLTALILRKCFKLDKTQSWLLALAALSGLILLGEWFIQEYIDEFGLEGENALPPIEAWAGLAKQMFMSILPARVGIVQLVAPSMTWIDAHFLYDEFDFVMPICSLLSTMLQTKGLELPPTGFLFFARAFLNAAFAFIDLEEVLL
jgi:hypothetical protein